MIRLLTIFSILCFSQISLSQSNKSQLLGEKINSDLSREELLDLSQGLIEAVVDVSEISLNLSVLDPVLTNADLRNVEPGSVKGNEFLIELPGVEVPLNMKISGVNEYVEDVFTYSGQINDDENAYFTFSVSNGVITGKAVHLLNNYIFIHDSERRQIVFQLDPKKIPFDRNDFVELEEPTDLDEIQTSDQNKVSNNNSRSSTTLVSILFLYSSDTYDPGGTISSMISEFNIALSASGISNKYIVSAGLVPLNTTFPGQCKNAVLNDMTGANGIFSTLPQKRNAANADIVFTVINNYGVSSSDPFCRVGGIANLPSNIINSNTPYAVTADYYVLSDNTGTHEVGHVLQSYHVNDVRGNTNDSRGFHNPPQGWQSMMGSYEGGCAPFNGPNTPCTRLNQFSNLVNTYNGDPIGGTDKNVAGWLNNTALPTASNYRNSIPPLPSVPTNLIVSPGNCYGLNGMSWSHNGNNTLHYVLSYSTQSNFTNSTPYYNGWDTYTTVNVFNGTWYFRVKACNASGCSGWSNQVAATRINTCN